MKIPYTTDAAYLEYFKSAAEGNYDKSFFKDRARVVAFGAGTAVVGAFRTVGRAANLITEFTKVIFYAMAVLVTRANHGNINRLKAHRYLLDIGAAALFAQPLQMLIHTLAIGVGIIYPKAAYRMMQAATIPLNFITAREKLIWNQYKTPEVCEKMLDSLKDKITRTFDNGSRMRELILTSVVHEFSFSLASALVAPFGYMDSFHLFGANPKVLTDEQKALTPILLLHGNYSHQATFLPLLQALDKSGNKRPVYTLKLRPNSVHDTAPLSAKIASIKEQYGKANDSSFKIDMVGHSMGSGCMQHLSKQNVDFKMQRGISIGGPFGPFNNDAAWDNMFDITGKKDKIVWGTSVLDEAHKEEIDSGHLELLFHPQTLKATQKFLAT